MRSRVILYPGQTVPEMKFTNGYGMRMATLLCLKWSLNHLGIFAEMGI